MQCFALGAFTPRHFSVTGATNATPVVITTSAPNSFVNGDIVTVAGVTGNTGANGTFPILVVDSTHAVLVGSVGNGAFGGTATASSPTQVPWAANDPTSGTQLATRISFVPRATNTLVSFVGLAGLNQATGAAVIRDLNSNTSGAGRLDWLNVDSGDNNQINVPDYWIDCKVPTELVLVTYWKH
jgi:hypothetical protein